MTLCNLRRQKTLLKDYSMRVKHQTDRLIKISGVAGADPGFFLGGGALVSCSTSTPINHIVFFYRIPVVLEKRRSSQGGAHPLHPPPRSTPGWTIVL